MLYFMASYIYRNFGLVYIYPNQTHPKLIVSTRGSLLLFFVNGKGYCLPLISATARTDYYYIPSHNTSRDLIGVASWQKQRKLLCKNNFQTEDSSERTLVGSTRLYTVTLNYSL